MLTIAASIFAAAGWLAFAKEWRAHVATERSRWIVWETLKQVEADYAELYLLTKAAPPTHPESV